MEESMEKKQRRRLNVLNKIAKLKGDIEVLENNLDNGDKQFHSYFLAIKPTDLGNGGGSILQETSRPAKLSKLLEIANIASGFKMENFSRKLRFNPGEFYVYDCILEGRTSSLKFIVKFAETLQGLGCECGEISSMDSEVVMTKGDPESLSDWISECCSNGYLSMFINGLMEFTELANNRRSILRSLSNRGKSGKLGSCSFVIVGEDDGVMVFGVGPNKVNLFSIKWKIVYLQTMKSMKSTFTVVVHEKDLKYESAEVFDALQRPFITEEDLPLLWDGIADTLLTYS